MILNKKKNNNNNQGVFLELLVAAKKFEILDIMIQNESLSYIEKMKFLGVVLDNKLKFDEHISNMCNKISKISFIFNKLSYIVPPNISRTIYFSLFHPHITYPVEI